MSSAAFFFGSLTAVLVIAISSCPEHISCPCGSSNKIYTFCVNDTRAEPYTCDRWAHCETCEDNITHCVTCPPSRKGLFCLEDSTVFCPDPGPILFGIRRNGDGSIIKSTQDYREGQIVFYSCRDGYELRGYEAITCLRTRAWSNKKPRCLKRTIGRSRAGLVRCLHPGLNENTALTGDYAASPLDEEFPPGVELRYVCKKGFEPEGPLTLHCLRTGRWTSDALTCRSDSSNADQCMNYGPISNGFVLVIPNNRFQPSSSPSAQTDFEYPVGTRLHYSCTHGYVLRGERELVCESGGFWSEEVPVCMEDTSLKIKL